MNAGTIQLSKDLQGIAQRLAADIERSAGEPIAFAVLFAFTDGRASYISTADREVVRRELRRVLDLWDQGMPDVPAHEVVG